MSDDKNTDDDGSNTLGLVFLIMGASMCITFGMLFGPAFAASGLAFVLLGVIYMAKGNDKAEDSSSEDER